MRVDRERQSLKQVSFLSIIAIGFRVAANGMIIAPCRLF
jgi:hypothetical protein